MDKHLLGKELLVIFHDAFQTSSSCQRYCV